MPGTPPVIMAPGLKDRQEGADMAGEETEGGRGTGGRALAAAGCVAAAALLVAAAGRLGARPVGVLHGRGRGARLG